MQEYGTIQTVATRPNEKSSFVVYIRKTIDNLQVLEVMRFRTVTYLLTYLRWAEI